MIHPQSAYEDIESGSRRILFTLLGVPWTVTPKSLLFIPTRIGFGMIISFLFLSAYPFRERVLFGIIYGFLVAGTNVLHIIGHTLGGKYVNAPMDENLITEFSIFTAYLNDPDDLPARVHLCRALGGPITNILIGAFGLLIQQRISSHLLLFFALMNLLLGLAVLLPIPAADGEILWREIRRKNNPKNGSNQDINSNNVSKN